MSEIGLFLVIEEGGSGCVLGVGLSKKNTASHDWESICINKYT